MAEAFRVSVADIKGCRFRVCASVLVRPCGGMVVRVVDGRRNLHDGR